MLDRLLTRLRRAPHAPPTGLHTCVVCDSDFVNPVDWEAVGPAHWWIRLRCGACETFREVTVENDVAARFEVELDERARLVAREVDRVVAADVEMMIAVLRRGPGR